VALEILLESSGFGRITECNGNFNPPGKVNCGRSHFSQIVLLQTTLKITGEAGVMAVRVINADELIRALVQDSDQRT